MWKILQLGKKYDETSSKIIKNYFQHTTPRIFVSLFFVDIEKLCMKISIIFYFFSWRLMFYTAYEIGYTRYNYKSSNFPSSQLLNYLKLFKVSIDSVNGYIRWLIFLQFKISHKDIWINEKLIYKEKLNYDWQYKSEKRKI